MSDEPQPVDDRDHYKEWIERCDIEDLERADEQKPKHFYNEIDPHAAAWLRGLIAEGLIPDGVVDERSITEIKPHELSGYTQCHFFAGIGGWPLAFQLAGWPATRPVGSGSCPCQPYSAAGKGLGDEDPRNLWPAFFRLIAGCKALGQPWAFTVFGEQVSSAIGKGWLDGVSADLEGEGYACGAVVLGAHSVGAPHQRARLFWVADAQDADRRSEQPASGQRSGRSGLAGSGSVGRLADSLSPGLQGHAGHGDGSGEPGRLEADSAGSTAAGGATGRVGDSASGGLGVIRDEARPGSSGHADGSGVTDGAGPNEEAHGSDPQGRPDALGNDRGIREQATTGATVDSGLAHTNGGDAGAEREQRCREQRLQPGGHWSDAYWLPCRDGKHRRVPTEPALFPLADGLPYKLARRGSIRPALLKGAGNAIVPETAAIFIQAYDESLADSLALNPAIPHTSPEPHA